VVGSGGELIAVDKKKPQHGAFAVTSSGLLPEVSAATETVTFKVENPQVNIHETGVSKKWHPFSKSGEYNVTASAPDVPGISLTGHVDRNQGDVILYDQKPGGASTDDVRTTISEDPTRMTITVPRVDLPTAQATLEGPSVRAGGAHNGELSSREVSQYEHRFESRTFTSSTEPFGINMKTSTPKFSDGFSTDYSVTTSKTHSSKDDSAISFRDDAILRSSERPRSYLMPDAKLDSPGRVLWTLPSTRPAVISTSPECILQGSSASTGRFARRTGDN